MWYVYHNMVYYGLLVRRFLCCAVKALGQGLGFGQGCFASETSQQASTIGLQWLAVLVCVESWSPGELDFMH